MPEQLPEFGLNPSHSLLSDDQIVELKKQFKNDTRLMARVCSFLAINQLLHDEGEGPGLVESGSESYPATFTSLETREDFAFHASIHAAQRMVALDKAINLPGAEWPRQHALPERFAFALMDMEAVGTQSRGNY